LRNRTLLHPQIFRISINLGLLVSLISRFSFHSLLLGPQGIISPTQAGSWKYYWTNSVLAYPVLLGLLIVCLLLNIVGIQKRCLPWLTTGLFLTVIHLFSSPIFPAYLTLTSEIYFLWPLIFLALQQSDVFEPDSWPSTLLIFYTVYLYLIPLSARALAPDGWLDGRIIEITLNELVARPSGWRALILSHPTWMQMLAIATLVIEASSPLLIFCRYRRWIALLLIVFHLLIAISTHAILYSVLMISLLIPIAFYRGKIVNPFRMALHHDEG
jgi:hypothetical protein